MDRLSPVSGQRGLRALLFGAAALLGACDDEGGSEPPASAAPGRVVALPAAASEAEDPSTFCEVYSEGSEAPSFGWPEAMEGDAPAGAEGWRWVNVWATWCRPCVEEMPRLEGFRGRLEGDGVPVSLSFVSADAEAEAVATFRAEHPEHPEGPRVPDTEALRTWLGGFGLDEGAPLPIHLFIDPAGKVRCARTAAIGDDDYESVKALLSGG